MFFSLLLFALKIRNLHLSFSQIQLHLYNLLFYIYFLSLIIFLL